MTDADADANGFWPRPNSRSRVTPDFLESTGQGDAERFGASAATESGAATSWPGLPGVARPAGRFPPVPGEAAPPAGPGTEPARTDCSCSRPPSSFSAYAPVSGPEAPTRIDAYGAQLTRQDGVRADDLAWEDRRRDGGVRVRYEPRRAAPGAPVVGPTAALQGRAGGPGFDVADGTGTADGSAYGQSGWQQAHGVWEGSGISWNRPATTLIDGQMPAFARSSSEAMYLSAPVATAYAPPSPSSPPPPPPPRVAPAAAVPAVGVDASPEASADSGATGARAGRSGTAWHVARVGLPAAVIVMVGAGAVMMLTGKSGALLGGQGTGSAPSAHSTSTGGAAASGGPGSSAPGSSAPGSSAPGSSGQGTGAPGTGGQGTGGFPGYPGAAGTVTVSSMASAAGTALAVGSADGRPAIWRRNADGSWALESARQPAVFEVFGNEGLTSITHGPAGWLAVGGAASGTTADSTDGTSDGPVILTSADGTTWHSISGIAEFAGAGVRTTAVAASGHGYVVAGHEVSGDQTFAALWWSPDLKHWVRIPNGGLAGRLVPSDILGVTAVDGGIVAIGSRENAPSIWVSGSGQTWGQGTFTLPGGATSGSLHLITVRGNTIVTAGNATTASGTSIPVVITSTDDDKTWQQITLAQPGVTASVTSLTAKGSGFTATGESAGKAVTWTSPDGLTWTENLSAG